jgi:ADP-heptose:LPS heptosyltransferase
VNAAPNTRRSVLVARLDNSGDVLLTGPAVRAVAAAGPQVTFLAGPSGMAAAGLLPGVDRVLQFHAAWIDPEGHPVERRAIDRLVQRIEALAPDRAIVLTSFHQSPLPLALLLRLAGVPTIAAVSPDYPGTLLDVRHRVAGDVHEVERNLSLVATLGYRLSDGDDGRLAVRTDVVAAARAQLPRLPSRYVVVHPGASVPARAWGEAANAAAVAELARAGWPVVVTGGQSERRLTAAVAGDAGLDLGGRTSLAGLAAVLEDAAAVVCGNTGAAHLAAAVGTPVVSLFAPTVPAVRWRPRGVPHVLLGDQDIECRGCRARVCPVVGHPCLAGVRPAGVVAAVERLASSRHKEEVA